MSQTSKGPNAPTQYSKVGTITRDSVVTYYYLKEGDFENVQRIFKTYGTGGKKNGILLSDEETKVSVTIEGTADREAPAPGEVLVFPLGKFETPALALAAEGGAANVINLVVETCKEAFGDSKATTWSVTLSDDPTED